MLYDTEIAALRAERDGACARLYRTYNARTAVGAPRRITGTRTERLAHRARLWTAYTRGLSIILGSYDRRIKEASLHASLDHRPGVMAAEYAAETGCSYEQALVACNMD